MFSMAHTKNAPSLQLVLEYQEEPNSLLLDHMKCIMTTIYNSKELDDDCERVKPAFERYSVTSDRMSVSFIFDCYSSQFSHWVNWANHLSRIPLIFHSSHSTDPQRWQRSWSRRSKIWRWRTLIWFLRWICACHVNNPSSCNESKIEHQQFQR